MNKFIDIIPLFVVFISAFSDLMRKYKSRECKQFKKSKECIICYEEPDKDKESESESESETCSKCNVYCCRSCLNQLQIHSKIPKCPQCRSIHTFKNTRDIVNLGNTSLRTDDTDPSPSPSYQTNNQTIDQLSAYRLYQQAVNAATPTREQLESIGRNIVENQTFENEFYQTSRAESIASAFNNAPTYDRTQNMAQNIGLSMRGIDIMYGDR